MFGFLLLLVLLLLAVAAIPTWPHSRRWGYAPAGAVAALLILAILAAWFGLLAVAWPWYP